MLDLTARDGGVASYAWEDDGALSLTMIAGAGLRVCIARGLYATSGDDWAEHPLAEIQTNAPAHLGRAAEPGPAKPEPVAGSRARRTVWIVLAVIVVMMAAVALCNAQQ
ncbi:MAG: hypothetical protein JWQ16_1954 [Novosphingobium sp.]|nr:hypothetical protein [Novosphingobium sp.]